LAARDACLDGSTVLMGQVEQLGPLRAHDFQVGDGSADGTDQGAVCGRRAEVEEAGIFAKKARVQPAGDVGYEQEAIVLREVA